MKISDAVFGVILVVFAAIILIYSRTLPTLPGYAYGSGFFPSFTAIFILCGGIALAIRGVRERQPLLVLGEWTKSLRLISNICVIPLSIVFYIALSDTLGFVLTSFLMMSGTIWWLRRKILSTVIVSGISSALIYIFFAKMMLVPLPTGFLGI
ncbi:MAG: tripartite tricarboxylate transporter TctB family protein [Synergistaceae bacterium]|jgi:putative tricarboxylic transport membrane protein|nr:tripartite tricarboxylate transporter TctB family protein [Synergistaceae bacterium]